MEHNGSTLTPKNWTTFQHYRDRRPTWIKLHKTILDDPVFNRLPVASQALAPKLWLLASEYDDGGIELTHDEIAFRLRTTQGEFEKALSPLTDAGYFILSGEVGLQGASHKDPIKDISASKIGGCNAVSASSAQKSRPSSQSEVEDFCVSIGLPRSDGEAMWLDWVERGYGKTRDWKAKIQKWKIHGYHASQKQQGKQKQPDPNQSRKDEQYAVFLRERAERKAALNG